MPSTRRTRCWGPPSLLDGKFSSDNPSISLLLFCTNTDILLNDFSGKPPTAKLKVNPRAGLGRGRGIRFSPANAPGTPVVAARGTLQSDNLRITGLGDSPQLTERLAEKRPLVESSSPITKAEAPAKDALAKKKSASRSSQVSYIDRDPRDKGPQLHRQVRRAS